MGTVLEGKEEEAQRIKDAALSANSVPALQTLVGDLADELSRIKKILKLE